MRKIIFLFILLAGVYGFGSAQDNCKSFLPDEGTTLVYNNFDKKGKLTGTTTTKVISVVVKEDGTHYKVNQLVSDGKKKKNDVETQLEYNCVGDKFFIDMQSILLAEQMQSFEGGKVIVETEDMFIPSNLEPGMELNDGHLKMDVSVEYMTMTVTARSFYRKVEGIEEIKTPAGNFTAWKINGNIESKFGFMRVAYKTVEWYVENVGIVKSEYYDNKAKLMGSTELQSIN